MTLIQVEKSTLAHKKQCVEILKEMELTQIAEWLHMLPDHRWEQLFSYCWPVLAQKCGVYHTTDKVT